MSDAPHLVFVHGWGSSPAVWQPLCDHLSSFPQHCLRYGQQPDSNAWLQLLADAIRPATVLVGWSLGAMLALEAASPVRAKILIGGTRRFVSDDPETGWAPRILQRMQVKLQRAPEQTLATFSDAMFSPAEQQADWPARYRRLLQEPEGIGGSAFSAAGLSAGLDYLANRDLRTVPSELASPLLWLHGTADSICPPAAPRPGRTIWLEGAGHVPQLTQTEDVAKAIEEFLREHQH